jgi:hypothetical protein
MRSQPVVGFHVASVHSMTLLSAMEYRLTVRTYVRLSVAARVADYPTEVSCFNSQSSTSAGAWRRTVAPRRNKQQHEVQNFSARPLVTDRNNAVPCGDPRFGTGGARATRRHDVSESIEVKGYGGQVTFDGQTVTLHRKGFLARSTVGKGDKRIPVRHISAVQFKPAGIVANGFIQFSMGGGVERRSQFGTQSRDAANDENSVMFTKQQQPSFERLRGAIEAAMAAIGDSSVLAAPDIAGQIAKLNDLRTAGALSAEEFETAKARLLGSL